MKKKLLSMMLAVSMTALAFTGCGAASEAESTIEELVAEETEESIVEETSTEEITEEETEAAVEADNTTMAMVGVLKGPTAIGTAFLNAWADKALTDQDYVFTMETAADELLPLIIKGEIDIALVPANVASVLYNKTEGGISVIDINTLGVLYMVSGDQSITGPADLAGKTVYLTGKGTTPDYVLHNILEANGLSESDLTLEYKSEPTEVAAILAQNSDAVGLLPQPFVTVACSKNASLSVVMDLTEQWDAVNKDSRLVTGVTVVRNQFLEEHPNAVKSFLADHARSVDMVYEDTDMAAQLTAEFGIVDNEDVARKAIPQCNIVCIQGEEMKSALSGYLKALYDQDPSSVGGNLPGEEFDDGFSDDFVLDLSKVYPRLKKNWAKDPLKEVSLTAVSQDSPDYGDMPMFRYMDSYVYMFIQDMGNMFTYLSYGMLPEGITPQILQEHAFRNLSENINYRSCESKEKGIYGILAGGDFEAESLLFPGIWNQIAEELNDDVIFCIPTKDIVFYTAEGNRKLRNKMLKMAADMFESNRRETPHLLFSRDVFVCSKKDRKLTVSRRYTI